jgi:hypothetical protein
MIINGVRWRVRMVSPSHPLLLTPWNTHALGVCDKITQTICIDKTLSPQLIKITLCHEIVHAFMFSYGIDLSYAEEEMVAELMSYYGENIIQHTNAEYDGIKQK